MINRYSQEYLASLVEHLESNSQQLLGKNSHVTILEPHQQEAMTLMGEAIASGKRRFSIVQPGGSGKTILQAGLALSSMQVREKLRKEGILEKDAHRKDLIITTERQLVAQIREKIAHVLDVPLQDIGIWGGGRRILDREIIVATQQSLKRSRRELGRYLPLESNSEGLDLILVDEADTALTELGHEIISKLLGIVDAENNPRSNDSDQNNGHHPLLVGLTATDSWSDGRDIDDLFGEKIHKMELKEGILQGINAPPVAYIFEAAIDESAIKRAGGDYDEASLAAGLKSAEVQKGVIEVWERLIGMENRKKYPTLVFVPSVSLVEETVAIFQKRYGSSLSVVGWTGDSKTADDLQRDTHEFNEGKIDILICCQMGGRGMDVPRAACLIDGFPTLSETKGNQRWSRVLRRIREGSDVQKTGFEKNLALIAHIIPRANKFRPITLLDLLDAWEGFEQGDMVKPEGKPIPPPDEYRGRSREEELQRLRDRIRRTHAFGEATVLEVAKVDVLRELRQEYLPRDETYYRNPENLKYDLEEFRKAAGVKNIPELTAGNICGHFIICKTGEEVSDYRYLKQAQIVLNIEKSSDSASWIRYKVLKTLIEILGFKINEYVSKDTYWKAYYENPDNVKADVEALREKAGVKSIFELDLNKLRDTNITCQNGSKINGTTYLRRFGATLGIKSRLKEALEKLFERAKAFVRNKKYYEDSENVKYDLEEFRKAAGLETIDKLDVNNIYGLTIVCRNGERVKAGNYIKKAGMTLGIVNDEEEASIKHLQILESLKKTVSQAPTPQSSQ